TILIKNEYHQATDIGKLIQGCDYTGDIVLQVDGSGVLWVKRDVIANERLIVGSRSIKSIGNVLSIDGTTSISGSLNVDGMKYTTIDNKKLYTQESPELWIEDFGQGTLSSGATTVILDNKFINVIDDGYQIKVFLTLTSSDCPGLYVTNKTGSSFGVKEINNGTSTATFDYRVVGKRKGYATIRF
ncbi:hypothetical protein HY793_02940, partial [Candidatus Desantisbacteria bacterium]|nr:hypothetical protein [Candidatus Desantisbacteria bacterium]